MWIFKKVNIGFILTPGFRTADIVELDAIFRFHPNNNIFHIAEKPGIVNGKSNFGMEANTTFDNCKDLDVLIVGEMIDEATTNIKLLQFIAKIAPKAKFIIGISNGVWALYKANVISNQKVTADRSTINLLKQTDLKTVNERRCVVDGRIITSGPSSGAIEAGFTVFNNLRGEWLTKFTEFNLEYNAHIQFPVEIDTVLEQPALPRSLKIGVFAAPDIFIPDLMGAVDVFGSIPNAEFYYLAHEQGISKSVIGFGPKMVANTSLDESPDLDILIFGATHPRYIKDLKLLDFILKQDKNASVIISVCAGTFVVGSTGLLDGKQAATNYHQISDLPRLGARYTGKEVEEDGKYLSAGPAVGSYEVGLKAVEKIIGKEWAQYIEHEVLEFAPKPIYGTTLENANKSILNVTHMASFFLKRFYRPAINKGYFGQGIKPNIK